MISLIYLFIITCISTHATIVPTAFPNSTTQNENLGVNQKIYDAEQLIKQGNMHQSISSQLPWDCGDVLESGNNTNGVYTVWPVNRILSAPISVYCDMKTDGGGWTVLQRRGDFLRNVDYFHKDWKSYKEGFGNLKEDFWLGNDNIYALSNQRRYMIRIELGALDGSRVFAVYNNFWIDDESYEYRLHVDGYSGNAGDSLSHHNGMRFSTEERDNDNSWWWNCAYWYRGGWWFNACHPVNLNGDYHKDRPHKNWEGIIWDAWKGSWESLTVTEMKIRKAPKWIKSNENHKKEQLQDV